MADKKRTTIRDVARHSGVSIATISNVINGKLDRCSPETRQRVLASMETLGFEPDFTARSLSLGTNRLIGLVLPITIHEDRSTSLLKDNPFYSEFYDGLNQVAVEAGYDILITGLERPEDSFPWARKRKMDGLIYLGSAPQGKLDGLEGIPNVVVDGDRAPRGEWTLVRSDDEGAAREAVDTLMGLGHRRIGFLSGTKMGSSVNEARFRGYRKALERGGLSPESDFILEEQTSFDGGYRAGGSFLARGGSATAVFCAADVLAFGFIQRMQDEGVAVPGELSVFGFDDISLCRLFRPLLSTVRQDITGKGRRAMAALLSLIEKEVHEGGTELGQDIVIPHSLALRSTTSVPRRST